MRKLTFRSVGSPGQLSLLPPSIELISHPDQERIQSKIVEKTSSFLVIIGRFSCLSSVAQLYTLVSSFCLFLKQ